MSVRHLSFLENGRTRPSAAAVKSLVKSIGLKGREAAALFLAAGHSLPAGGPGAADSDGVPEVWRIMLRGADPVPTSIMNQFGHILAVNRSWVALHRLCLGEKVESRRLNALELFLDPGGWRRYIDQWVDAACVILVIMQQEAILARNYEALDDIRRWSSTPGLPHTWPVVGARLSQDSSDYGFEVAIDTLPGATVKIVHSALGYFPSQRSKTCILQSVYLQAPGLQDWLSKACTEGVAHPLCPY